MMGFKGIPPECMNLFFYIQFIIIIIIIYILIVDGGTFPTFRAHVCFVFLPGGISKEWRQIVSPNCDVGGETGPILQMFTGLSGNTWKTARIAHESHNDVRRLCWRHLRAAGRTWAAKGPVIFTGCS